MKNNCKNSPIQVIVIPQPISSDLVLLVIDLISQFQPGVRQCTADIHPLMPVEGQQLRDEVPAFSTEAGPPFFIVPLPSSFTDSGEGFTVVDSSEGRMAAEENVGDDANAPHVSCEGDTLAAGHLWCHELWHAVVERGVLVELNAAREAEVADL